MFQGNLYFPLPLAQAVDLYTDFDSAVANGLVSNPAYAGDGRLHCFHSEKDAIDVGRNLFLNTGATIIPGTRLEAPVFAVIHIGPIAPMGLPAHVQSEVTIFDRKALIIEQDGVQRIAQIVRNGSFAYNAVNMTMKIVTV